MEVTRGWGETGEYTNRRDGSFVTSTVECDSGDSGERILKDEGTDP